MGIEPLDKKLEAFGAQVVKVNGNDHREIAAAAERSAEGKPLFILCYTDPCFSIPLLEKRRPKLHYVRFTSDREREEYRLYYNTNLALSSDEMIKEDYRD
jgi:transketolase